MHIGQEGFFTAPILPYTGQSTAPGRVVEPIAVHAKGTVFGSQRGLAGAVQSDTRDAIGTVIENCSS